MRSIAQERRRNRDIRHKRIRRRIHGSTEHPRLAVFRSLRHMYAQIIDDDGARTLCAISSLENAGLIQRAAYQSAIDVPTINGRDTDVGLSSALGGPSTSGGLDDREPNPMTLDEVKRRAVRGLHDRLGPEADSLAMRIESCRTIEEFRYRVREAERLISTALGANAAQEYLKALRRRS